MTQGKNFLPTAVERIALDQAGRACSTSATFLGLSRFAESWATSNSAADVSGYQMSHGGTSAFSG